MRKHLALLILGLVATASPSWAQDDFKPEPGFTSLFNGKDLSGWYYKGKDKTDLAGKTETFDKRFTVEGGAIVANVGKGIKDVYTTQSFDRDFVVKMEFRASLKSDSGVYIRGPQLQIRDFIRRGEQKHLKSFKNDDWNELVITVEGTTATYTCNGEPLKSPDKMSIPQKGGIGLQAEDGKFEFRRIRIKVADAGKPNIKESPANPAKEVDERPGPGAPKKRLLLISESSGYAHQVSARQYTILTKDENLDRIPKIEGLEAKLKKDKKGKTTVSLVYRGRLDKPLEIKDKDEVLAIVKPCLVETTFMELAKKHGFEVDCSQDSRVEITGENLKKYDALFFYTTGDLPLSEAQKSDLLAFVRKDGKGFGGSHCATDTYRNWKEYNDLIGGAFISHPWTQKIRVIVEDKNHAATKHLGDSFFIKDEIYQYRAPYPREKGHVLLSLDMESVNGLGSRKDKDNAIAWTHEYGKGRVFYTALGHFPEVWNDDRFQQHVMGGLQYMFGRAK